MIVFPKDTVKDEGTSTGLGNAETGTGVKSKTLQLLQEQVSHEFFAERLYLAIAVWLDQAGFPETAYWFSEHAEEERGHAMRFVNFILKRGEKVIIPGTKEPPTDFEDVESVFTAALDHERFVSEKITKIYTTSLEEADIMATEIAREFIEEQVEEEQVFLSLYNLFRLENKITIDMEAQMKAFAEGHHRIGKLEVE